MFKIVVCPQVVLANVLEIVLAVGMVTWTSFTSQIAKIKLDTQFEPKV